VVDQGRTYIFRLREAEWSDGGKVTAADVVIILKRAIAPQSRNPLKPFLTAIDDIVSMTDQVIEVRLSRPRPDLLKLFAQPELAVRREIRRAGADPSGSPRPRPIRSCCARRSIPRGRPTTRSPSPAPSRTSS